MVDLSSVVNSPVSARPIRFVINYRLLIIRRGRGEIRKKNILRKSMLYGTNAERMLYEWRNVPRSDGYSPAQLIFGHAQRTPLSKCAN